MEETIEDGKDMTVQCIYGSQVQKEAWKTQEGRSWCRKHCKDGYERGAICYWFLKRRGINPETGKKEGPCR